MGRWDLAFVAAVMGAAAVLLGYSDFRRLLHFALDDRYGQWTRFQSRARRLPSFRKGLTYRLRYAVAFFFLHGLRDLRRLVMLLLFDLFVVFAILSPFWRSVFFEDWSPLLGAALALAGVSLYTIWKLRLSLELCRVHAWSEPARRCEKCGEHYAQGGETGRLKGGAGSAPRTGWHGIWERRLEKMTQQLAAEAAESPRPAG